MWHVLLWSVTLAAQLPVPGDNPVVERGAEAPSADVWRVATVASPSGVAETRVLRADGTLVTVGEGLGSLGLRARLVERARAGGNVERQTETLVGHGVALGTAGVVTVISLAAAVVGAGFWAWRTQGVPKDLDARMISLVNAGPSITVAGLLGSLMGVVAVVASAGLWAWLLLRPAPEPAASVVDGLAASLAWGSGEAQEVVDLHNAQL